jgi:hypothetical protein
MAVGDIGQIYQTWDIGLSVDVTVEALIDDWEGFRVIVRDYKSGRMIRIAFDTKVAYQNRDESDAIGELQRAQSREPSQFYRVTNSEFIARFMRDTARPYISENLRHFAIITESDCIDVLAETDPRIEDLKEVAQERAARS